MASIPTLPALPNEEKLISAVEYGQLENFYQLEKANATLNNLQSIFLSFKKTLESSYALQERDSDYLKTFNQEEELRRLETEREIDTSMDRVTPADGKDGAVNVENLRGFGTGFGLSLGKLLRGGALAGMAFLFADEIAKAGEVALRLFFKSVGFENDFTNAVSETLGKAGAAAAIGAAIGSMFGPKGALFGAIIGAAISIGESVRKYIDNSMNDAAFKPGAIAEYAILGTTIGAMFGPKGALVGAILGGVVGLGKSLLDYFDKENAKKREELRKLGLPTEPPKPGEKPPPPPPPDLGPTPPAAIPTSPVLGSISARFESGRGGVGTISSGTGDPGGKSYGTYQLATKTGTMAEFLRSEEGKGFAEKYYMDPAKVGTPQFDLSYKAAVKAEPEKFAEAQRKFIERTHFQPVATEAQKLGFNVQDPRIQEALFSQSVQHGFKGNVAILQAAAATGATTAEEQVSALYKARTEYVSGLNLDSKTKGAIISRYQKEQGAVQQIVPVGTTSMTSAVVGGTEAARVSRDAVTLMPVTTIAPVSNVTQIANNSRTTVVSAQSPRNNDPTFMRVQELNFA